MNDMPLLVLIKTLMRERGLRLTLMAERLGIARQNQGAPQSERHDVRSWTPDGAANILDAGWVLVPGENLAEIHEVLTMKGVDPFVRKQAPVVTRSSRSALYDPQVAMDLQVRSSPALGPDPITLTTAERHELV